MDGMSAHKMREALESLVIDNPDLERLEELLDQFNIFEAIGVVRQELRHSDFLAFLLNPQQAHGLGDVFLKAFLQKVLLAARGTELPISLIDLDVWGLEETITQREWRGIDILLLNEEHKLAVIIENKIGSTEHSNQLERYYRVLKESHPDYRVIALFLTPDGGSPSDERFLPVSYATIAELVESLVRRRESTLGTDVKALMTHYAQMLRRHIVSESEIAELCRKIYHKHQRALDLILEHRPDMQSSIGQILEGLIVQTLELVLDKAQKWEVRFAPAVWDQCIPKTETNWSTEGRMMLLYFENQPDRLRLILTIGPGDNELRSRFYAIAQDNEGLLKPGKAIKRMCNQIWSERVLSPSDYADSSIDELEEKIIKYWEKFLNEKLPILTDVIRTGITDNGS